MAQTVRIDEATHALLKRLAEADRVTLQEELAKAVQARRRERFFEEMAAGYAAMTADERNEEVQENALWDNTSSDGTGDE